MFPKEVWKAFTGFILYTSIFAAACTVSLCMATERLIILRMPPLGNALHTFVFGCTLMVYNVHYLTNISLRDAGRNLLKSYLKSRNFSGVIVGLLVCLGSVPFLPVRILVVCVVLGVLSFAYSIPFLPFMGRRRLRDFGWVKILVLSSVWTVVTAILPMLFYDVPLAGYPFEIMLRFVFLLVLCIAFDIRDMQVDDEAHINTLPNRIGRGNSYRLINVALAIFILLSIIQYRRYPVAGRLAGEVLTALCTKLAIQYTRRKPSDIAYLAFIDGMMLLYGILMLIY